MNRRILTSLLVIGVVSAFATGSTFALFNDTETSSNNTFQAGALDLQVDYLATYNGEVSSQKFMTDNVGQIINLSDVKPGDQGNVSVSLHVSNNPGYLWINLNQTEDAENSCTEPEIDAEPGCESDDEGELDNETEVTVFYDDGDGIRQSGEEVIFEGTAAELQSSSVPVDGNPETQELDPVQPDQSYYMAINWELPRDTGNSVQTDSMAYDMEIYTEQARHNDNPTNPFN